MRVAVLRFPGANCDQDGLHALRDDVGVEAEYLWHEETSLAGFDAVFVPGGFTYGDYLRCGAIASRAPVMDAVADAARGGMPVIGVCNGFQVLCEAGLLPGALLGNAGRRFVCRDVWLRAENRASIWTAGADRPVRMPIAHGEGRYVCDEETLRALHEEDRIAFRYVDAAGCPTEAANPNGSIDNIAGVLDAGGNVLGLMPHPERATKALLGSTDGLFILDGLRLVAARR
ncbi:MAG TPA: phosphoribosylformylglycinamidine synthase subunit PurQ [Fimbriimonadaceae bacterium]|nr:phosphoribosylformylglycinamidine synthase subunit PurQ [Fimbriimonadaceae bacterium]HRJ97403.1 phosphoribosylformylglycinamidine synthase subunit PurQ [Fimbriimonadaceae bacterium]